MFSRSPLPVRTALKAIVTAATLIGASTFSLHAQATKSGTQPPYGTSRFDLYGGYGYLHPVNSDINNFQYQPINPGAVASITGYFNRFVGLQAEGSFFPHGPNDCVYTAQAGPVLRYQMRRFVPFAHALVGGAKVGGPVFQPCTWGIGVTGGMGVDYIVPGFGNHLAIRPVQADYEWSEVNYGPLVLPAGVTGGFGRIDAYRLSGGLVLRFADMLPPPAVEMACTAQPVDAYPGDPVTVTAVTQNVDTKKKVTYTWTTSGGKLTQNDATATVSTAGLAPGDYTVAGHVSEGRKPGEQASCNAGFRVHNYEPPTVACSANPSTVMPGESSTITSTGRSPQNRTLTYSYSSTGGLISGNAATATLSTEGATPGAITVTCNAVDDLGQQASSTTTVTVNAPPAPVAPQARNLCSLSFERDRKRPARVDNEAKGCLDDIALTLNREAGAKLVIVGEHTAGETPDAAAERALNTRQYLTDEKGIDASRIELRTSEAPGRTVENTLVPAGATFTPGATNGFDPATVHRHGQPYGTAGRQPTTRRSRNR